LAKENGYPFEELRACLNAAFMAKDFLDLPLADEMSQAAIDTAIGYEMGYLQFLGVRAEILMLMGNWVAAEDIVSELRGLDFQDRWEQAPQHVVWRLESRRSGLEARPILDEAWAATSGRIRNREHIAYAVAENMWITETVDPDRLADLHVIRDEMLRVFDSWFVGELDFYLWAVGEPVEIPDGIADGYRLVMEGHPAEAAEYWEAKGMPYEQAVALMHGDERARIKALDILQSLGATAVADKLKRGLRRDGIAIPRSRAEETRRHGAGLTTRQAEVLKLLKEDLSNIEIAERLFLSPRTVEHHVAAVMSKLNAPTRKGAVVVAVEQGLLASR
jgi:DNA-binding CsgD family transcriptional regulator